jgi:hypothetical protein
MDQFLTGISMFAMSGLTGPRFINAKGIFLLILLGFLAYLVSPLNPMSKKERHYLLLVYPALIIVYWFLVYVKMLSLTPYVHYLLDPSEGGVWLVNSLICLVFGAAFSSVIALSGGIVRRCYGIMFLVTFIYLVVKLTSHRPPMIIL